MAGQRLLGVLLIVGAILAGAVLWLLEIRVVEVGPEVIVGQGVSVSSQWVVSQVPVSVNWLVLVPLVVVVLTGVFCLLVPTGRGPKPPG